MGRETTKSVEVDLLRRSTTDFFSALTLNDLEKCTHIDGPALRGWGQIVRSWERTFSHSESGVWLPGEATVSVEGQVAWVTVECSCLTLTSSLNAVVTNVLSALTLNDLEKMAATWDIANEPLSIDLSALDNQGEGM